MDREVIDGIVRNYCRDYISQLGDTVLEERLIRGLVLELERWKVKGKTPFEVAKLKKSKYKILGGEEELPDRLFDIYFLNDGIFRIGEEREGRSRAIRRGYGKVNSAYGKTLVYLIEHLGETFGIPSIRFISGWSESVIRPNLLILMDSVNAFSRELQIFREGRPLKYGIRKKEGK